jgi:hypothetical protein
LVGDGRSDVRTDLSRVVVDGLQSIYDALGVNPANQDYVLGTETNAFMKADYREWDRTEGRGANPLQVCLMILALLLLGVGCVRGRRELRLPFATAIALCVGYVAFSAVARWSVFAVRYYVPLFVLWCPLIALAMRRVNRLVVLAVASILVIACLPQLLNSRTRSLLHPQFPFPTRLDGYYAGFDPHTASAFASMDLGVARVIAGSSCRSVGIANWILFEYPLWPALHDAGWRGTINDVDVTNQTRRLEPRGFHPCALVSEVDRPSVAPPVTHRPGMLAFRFGNLALLIDPENLKPASARERTRRDDIG